MFKSNIYAAIKRTPVGGVYIFLKSIFSNPNSQSNESDLIDSLVANLSIPKTFVEFGFSGWEFNCVGLAKNQKWRGLLVDGVDWNVKVAQQLYGKNVSAKSMWIDIDNMQLLMGYFSDDGLGVLSIDVDGNDYWFLERFISVRPAIISIEFNVSFGLRPITVLYDAGFDRQKKHMSKEYYGASLTALSHLCSKNGYSLVKISSNGVNAFFVRNDLMGNNISSLPVEEAYGPKSYPDGTVAPTDTFWSEIKGEEYVDVTSQDVSINSRGARIF